MSALGKEVGEACGISQQCGSICWIEVPLSVSWAFGEAQMVARRYIAGWIVDVVSQLVERALELTDWWQLHIEVFGSPPDEMIQAVVDSVCAACSLLMH